MVSPLCIGCGSAFEAKHPYARWCSKRCYDFHRYWPVRRERILAAIALRPRCVICSAPIRYGQNGVRYDSTTCGNRACAVRRNHWLGASVQVERKRRHREISRESMRRRRAA